MVICYHNCHSQLLCLCDLINGRNAIITGKYHMNAVCSRFFNNMFINTITILNALRYYIINFRSYPAQPLIKDAGRTHTVNIIISHDPDPGAASYLFL